MRDALLEAIHDASEDKTVKIAVSREMVGVLAGADLKSEALEIPPEHDGLRRSPATTGSSRLVPPARVDLAQRDSVHRRGQRAGHRGGCQLALACDLIYASQRATFWEIFARIGLPLEGGAAWLLTRSLSLPLAKEMALLSEPFSAKQAFEWRLINGCVPAEQLETVAAEVARKRRRWSPLVGSGCVGRES